MPPSSETTRTPSIREIFVLLAVTFIVTTALGLVVFGIGFSTPIGP